MLLQCVSRRDPVTTGLHHIIAGLWPCTQDKAQELRQCLNKVFEDRETRWDTARPNGGLKLLQISVNQGWQCFASFTEKLAQAPCPWSPVQIDECLSPASPGVRKAAAPTKPRRQAAVRVGYRRGSRIRVAMLVGSWSAGCRPSAGTKDWATWMNLMPGCREGAHFTNFLEPDMALAAIDFINEELALRGLQRPAPYDLHDFGMALCLRKNPNQYHKDHGRPFRVLGSLTPPPTRHSQLISQTPLCYFS